MKLKCLEYKCIKYKCICSYNIDDAKFNDCIYIGLKLICRSELSKHRNKIENQNDIKRRTKLRWLGQINHKQNKKK